MIFRFSKNFNSSELVVSDSFPELVREVVRESKHIMSAQALALNCLQPGRDKFGIFDILSWLRDEALNESVGGAPNSDHLLGIAADFSPRNFHPEQVFKWYVQESGVTYRQIIYYPDKKFIHISTNHPDKPSKREALVCTGPKKYVSYAEYYDEQ